MAVILDTQQWEEGKHPRAGKGRSGGQFVGKGGAKPAYGSKRPEKAKEPEKPELLVVNHISGIAAPKETYIYRDPTYFRLNRLLAEDPEGTIRYFYVNKPNTDQVEVWVGTASYMLHGDIAQTLGMYNRWEAVEQRRGINTGFILPQDIPDIKRDGLAIWIKTRHDLAEQKRSRSTYGGNYIPIEFNSRDKLFKSKTKAVGEAPTNPIRAPLQRTGLAAFHGTDSAGIIEDDGDNIRRVWGNRMAHDEDKVKKVMHEYKHGELHSGSKKGPVVTSRKQAIAIALSEERKAKGDSDMADETTKNVRLEGSTENEPEKEAGSKEKDKDKDKDDKKKKTREEKEWELAGPLSDSIALSTDAWSEEARRAALEARKRKLGNPVLGRFASAKVHIEMRHNKGNTTVFVVPSEKKGRFDPGYTKPAALMRSVHPDWDRKKLISHLQEVHGAKFKQAGGVKWEDAKTETRRDKLGRVSSTLSGKKHKRTERDKFGRVVETREEDARMGGTEYEDSSMIEVFDAAHSFEVTEATVYDSVVLDDAANVRFTDDGYLVASPRVARTGIQLYRGSECGKPSMDVVRVYRPEDSVFEKDAMHSFAHRPVTIEHPPAPITADNWKKYAVGQTGDEVVRDGNTVRVPMVLMDSDAIKEYKDGIRRQLSMGYTCDLEWTAGVTKDGEKYDAIQRSIRANHLAVVKNARGGSSLTIGDTKTVRRSVGVTTLSTDAWSEQARKAALEARKRKGGWRYRQEPYSLEQGKVGQPSGLPVEVIAGSKRSAMRAFNQNTSKGPGYHMLVSPKGERMSYNEAKKYRSKTNINTDAWSEKARQASAEARRRKSTSGELSAKIIPPSRKKIPRGQIEWVVNKYHVSKPESEVRSEFEKRLEKADWPPSKKREAIEYAVKHHRKNQGLYGKVMGGRI